MAAVHLREATGRSRRHLVLAGLVVRVLGCLTEQPFGVDRVGPLILVHGIHMEGRRRVGERLEVNGRRLVLSVADLVVDSFLLLL